MRDKGRVDSVQGKKAKVLLDYSPETCKKCAARHFCGIDPRQNEGFVWARFDKAPEPGQEVVVEIPEVKAVLLSTVVFIVPVIIYGLAFWIVHRWMGSVGWSALAATVPVLIYFPLLARLGGYFTPRIVE